MTKILFVLMVSCFLFPVISAQDAITDEGWREDIETLVTTILRVHPDPFRTISEADFTASVDALLEEVPDLSDNEIFVRMMRIVASIQDGHSGMYASGQEGFPIHFYPLRFYVFADGIYVVEASDDYAEFVGARLVSVDGIPADEVYEILRLSAAGDNPSTQIITTGIQINVPEILQGAGIMEAEPNYEFELPDGEIRTLNPVALELDELNENFPEYILPQTGNIPYLNNADETLWYEVLEDSRTFYVVYNMVRTRSRSGLTVRNVAEEIEAHLESDSIDRVIIDLRNNPGGNEGTSLPLSVFLINNEFFDEDGRLIVLTGPRTFSAAVVFSLRLEAGTSAVFIGEDTGGRPLMFENNSLLILQNSDIRLRIASRAREDVPAEDTRLAISPDILIPLRAEDYFAGLDPAFDAALGY
ncbi:MAG: hypothetical protein RLP44_18050 [Aggregatilineales bacterium]